MAKNSSNSAGVEGNTSSTPAKQPSPAKYWCFTHNFDKSKSIEDIKLWIVPYLEKLNSICKNFFIALEQGEKEERYHLQGYCHFIDKIRITGCKRVFDNTTHWELCKGSFTDNYLYVHKEPIKLWKKETDKPKPKIISKLLGWQEELLKLIKIYKDNDRIIIWIYDEVGGNGKTSLCKYLVIEEDFGYLNNAKTADICFYAKENQKKGYVFDFCRSNEKSINYQAIESLKNGILFSSKYESGVLVMDSPVIVIMANYPPNYDKLSKDRWVVKSLNNGLLSDYKEIDHIEEKIEIKEIELKPIKKVKSKKLLEL